MHPTVLAVTQSMPVLLMGLAVFAILCSAAVAPGVPELRQKRAALLREAEGIIAKADGEKRDLNDEEEKAVADRTSEAERILADVERVERRQSLRSTVAAGVAGLARPLGARSVETSAPAALGTIAPAVAREAWLDDPMRGFKSHRNFFQAVQGAYIDGVVTPQLRSLQAPRVPRMTAGSDEQAVGADPFGGFLVPRSTQPGVRTTPVEKDPFDAYITKIPMATPKVSINARVDKNHQTSVSGGLRVYRRAEAHEVTPARMQFEQVELNSDSLMGVAFATEEVLRDSPESFAAILERGFREEFAARKISERLGGTGVGEFLGINNANFAARIDVAVESGQTTATPFKWENLAKMRARVYDYENALWYANHDCLPYLMGVTQPGSTIPLFTQDAAGVTRLFGRPIVFGEFAESVNTVGDLVLGAWGEYLEGEYEPIQGASSVHVRFVPHETAFKFWMRNAGAPWWRSVMQPKKGATLAPFVRLATRQAP